MIDVLDGEDHRRFQFQNVVVGTAVTQDDLVLLHPGHDVLRLRGRWCLLDSIANQIDAHEQSDAANVADDPPSFRQFLQFRDQMAADFRCVLQKILAFDHLHHCVRHRARHRIATVLKSMKMRFYFLYNYSPQPADRDGDLRRCRNLSLTVLKYEIPALQKLRAISGVVMTAATG